MAETERRRRADCKINQLPPEVRQQVEEMISDTANSFQSISDWLDEQGYQISYAAVCRYAKRMNETVRRVAEELARTKVILDYIGKNPDVDATKAAQTIMTSNIMQRLSAADEEFYEMPIDKLGRLVASFQRVNIAEKKLVFEQRKKIDLAFNEMESQIMSVIKNDPLLSAQLHNVLIKTKEKMVADE